MVNNPYQQYQENSIMTARPEELTLMLYNGAIKFLKQALIHIEERHLDKANNSILKAEDILTELMSTLDMQYEVAHNLMSLYDFMYNWLIHANLTKTEGGDKKIRDVIGLLEDIRDAWAEAMKIAKTQQKTG